MDLQTIISTPLSGTTINNVLQGRANIIKLVDTSKYSTIDEIFGNFNHIILFIGIEKSNSGHWLSILRNGKNILWMDSVGFKPLIILEMMKKKGMNLWGQNMHILQLIKDSNYEFSYNTTKYQPDISNSDTCGRYSLLFVALNQIFVNHKKQLTVKIIENIMKHWLHVSHYKTYDQIVSELTKGIQKL